MTPYERVMARSETQPSGCRTWTGANNGVGYGVIRVGSLKDGTRRMKLTHRVVAEHREGRTLDPLEVVRHTCDTPACCESSHLLVGTQSDNLKDMVSKNRNALTKITERDSRGCIVSVARQKR